MDTRGPGWPTVLGLLLVVLTFSVVHPLQLMMVPLALLLFGLPPRRFGLLVFGAVLAVLAFVGPRGLLWSVERGWSLLLGGYFVLVTVAWPREAFTTRALAATGGAAVTAAVIIGVLGGWDSLDMTIARHYRDVAQQMAATWPGGLENSADVVELAAELPARLFPGFLAVGSVAGLAVAWWGYRRLARQGEPMRRLPEFRFPDALVWVLIAGIALLLVPVTGWAPRLGSNLVFFMGALYALRGFAVLAALIPAMVGAQLPAMLVLGAVGLLLYPIVVAGTLLLGVTDTWLDLRSGSRLANEDV
ncbi:MAG: DUF2232 domain-containing protein [Gemmatimonadota bacterium]